MVDFLCLIPLPTPKGQKFMLKILLFIDSLASGGAQRQIVGLAKLLKDRGYLVKVVHYHPIFFFRKHLEEHQVPNEYVVGSDNKLKRIFLIALAIRRFHPNVVISYLDTPNMIVCLLKLFGMTFKLITSERNTSQVLNFYERAKFFLLRWADVIVPNSYSQEQFIIDNFSNLAYKTIVINNYVDTNLFIPLHKKKHEKYRILVVARISRQKNALTFLKAINKLRNEGVIFFVDWYGRADDDTFSQCEAYIKRYQLGDFISFHDPTNNIVSVYQHADVFCLPSLYEGFPNVICEAMSCGLPILCSNVCDNPTLVESGKNGLLFNPNDVEDMANKIKSVLSLSTRELQEMQTYSRKIAKEKFSVESFINNYVKLIEG